LVHILANSILLFADFVDISQQINVRLPHSVNFNCRLPQWRRLDNGRIMRHNQPIAALESGLAS